LNKKSTGQGGKSGAFILFILWGGLEINPSKVAGDVSGILLSSSQ